MKKIIEWTEDDHIMTSIIDSSLEWLDTECDYFSEPVTVKDMRKWLKEKLMKPEDIDFGKQRLKVVL